MAVSTVLHVYLLTRAGQSSAIRQPLVMNNIISWPNGVHNKQFSEVIQQ